MTKILIFSFYIIFILFFYLIAKNQQLFLDNINYSQHKSFSNKIKNIPLLGGLFLFVSLSLFLDLNLNFIILFFIFFALGFCSDINLLSKAKTRFNLQALILLTFFFFFLDIQILSTRIEFFDKLLQNLFFNYFFCCFCLMILINGFNFIDGLNGLSLGYFTIVAINLFSINIFLESNYIFINDIFFLFSLLFILILILTSKIFLGDSGSYLIGIIIGLQIISINYYEPQISPYFLILQIWYPCFEVLFSMIRKMISNKSPLNPDTLHLHQQIYAHLKKKYSLKYANPISSIIILFYNLIVIFFSKSLIYNSLICIVVLCFNILLYLTIYISLKKNNYDFRKK